MKFKYYFFSLVLVFQTVVPSDYNELSTVSMEQKEIFERIIDQCEKLYQERQEYIKVGHCFATSAVVAAGCFSVMNFPQGSYAADSVGVAAFAAFSNYWRACNSKYEPLHHQRHQIKEDFASNDINRFQKWKNLHRLKTASLGQIYSQTIIAKTIDEEMMRMVRKEIDKDIEENQKKINDLRDLKKHLAR